jgi:hypothetical protein
MVDQNNKIKDDKLGQSDYLDQPLKNSLKINEPFLNYDHYGYEKENPSLWSQMGTYGVSFLDTAQGQEFKEGFMNENLLGILWTAAFNDKQQFEPDSNYKVWKDQKYRSVIEKNFHYFENSRSLKETEFLLKKLKEEQNQYKSPFWQGMGAGIGGLTDITSVFMFSKIARPLWMQSRLKRTINTTGILGAEETVKQLIDENRTSQHATAILGTNAVFQMILPSMKGAWTKADKEALDNFIRQADLGDEINHITRGNTNVAIKIVDDTGRWSKPDGTVVNTNPFDMKPPNWTQVSATMHKTDNGFEIRINKKLLEKQFKEKAWTKPRIKGVKPLPKDEFKTLEDWQEFVLNHEKAHTYNPRKKGETLGDYENRINAKALSAPRLPYSSFKAEEYLKNKLIYLEELENEQFIPTWLGKFGEASNWNPIQRLVNKGNLTAIKFGKAILKSPLFTKGNLLGLKTPASLEQWMKMDTYYLGTTLEDIAVLYSSYKKGLKGSNNNPITRAEFNERVSRGVVNPNYKDVIPEIRQATAKAKEYYKEIAKKIKESNPAYNTQEILVGQLEAKLKSTKGNTIIFTKKYQDGTTKTIKMSRKELREKIKQEKEYLEQIKKNPLRDNYLNRVINRQKIQSNISAWRAFATESIKRTMPKLSDQEILIIVKSYENKAPWKKFEANNLNKSHEDLIIEDYIFSPSGMSGNLKRRKLEINQEEWMKAGYFHSDVNLLMQMYHRSVLPDVYLTQIFGTPNAMGGQYFRTRGYQAGLKDVEAEYNAKINNAKTNKQKKKLEKERDEALSDMEAIRDLFKGVYGLSTDADSFYSKGIGMIKMFNAMTSLQGGLASVVDLGRSVFFNGLNRTLKSTWESFTSKMSKEVYKLTKQEGRSMGELFEIQMNTRAFLYNDINTLYNTGSKITQGMNKMTGAFFLLNLMSPWNQMIKTNQVLMIGNRILEESQNLIQGTISKSNELKLAQSGIDRQLAERIVRQYREYGVGVGARNTGDLQYNRIPRSSEWDDVEVANVFKLAVQNDVNISVVTPSLGDTPLWMSTQAGGLIAQFKKFSMGMTQRVLIRGLQEKDATFISSVITMIMLGAMVDMMRSKAFDQDYSQKSYSDKFMDAFERSGVAGIFMDVGNSAQRLLTADRGNMLGGTFGPTGSNVDKILNVLSGDENQRASNVRRLIPFQNIWYMDSIFDQIEKGLQ